jgi:hypothetical protein
MPIILMLSVLIRERLLTLRPHRKPKKKLVLPCPFKSGKVCARLADGDHARRASRAEHAKKKR